MSFKMEKYLKPTFIIDCNHISIQEKARDLTQGHDNDVEKAKALFYFVRDETKYNPYAPESCAEDFQASNTLAKREGYCIHKAILLVALARATGIPAGLGFANLRNYLLPEKVLELLGTNLLAFHGYTELYLNGNWVKATPAFDLKMCEENRFIPVEFDGVNDAMFHAHNLDGESHIEYLEDLGHYYDDFSVDAFRDTLIKTYGSKIFELPDH